MNSEAIKLLCMVSQVAVHIAPRNMQPEIMAAIESGKTGMQPEDLESFLNFAKRSPRPTRQAFQLLCTPEVFAMLDKKTRWENSGVRVRATSKTRHYSLSVKKMRKVLEGSGLFTEIAPDVWAIRVDMQSNHI